MATSLTFNADQYVTSIQEQANAFISAIQGYAQSTFSVDHLGYSYSPVDPSFTNDIKAAATSNVPPDPTFPALSANKPTMGTVGAINVPTFDSAPTFDFATPTITLPHTPDATLPNAPGSVPSFNAPDLPSDQTFELPAVPSIENIALPTLPSVDIPLYEPEFPVDDILAPTTVFEWNETEYTDELLELLKAKLKGDMVNGGYGIDDADEQRLWDRAREREMMNAEQSIQDIARQMAARGFSVPPGTMNAMMHRAQLDSLEKVSSLSRDILSKKADLYVQNRQFTIQQTRELETMLEQMHGFFMERAINAAKYMAEWGINIFNAQVSRYNARVAAVQVSAQVYEAKLRAALAHLEAYKQTLEGVRIAADVQKLYVDVYASQLQGVRTLAEVYSTRMNAARVQADIELVKLQGFKAQVDTYVAQVGAKESLFRMYQAQINGEMSKVEMFKAQVDAYGAKVNAYSSKVKAEEVKVQTQSVAANVMLDKYKAELSAYAEDLHAYASQVNAAVASNDAKLKKYQIRVDAERSAVDAKVQMWATNSNTFAHIAGVASSHILGQARAYIAHADSAVGAASSGLGAMGQALGAAASAAQQITAEII